MSEPRKPSQIFDRAMQEAECRKLLGQVEELTQDLFGTTDSNRFKVYDRFKIFVSDDHAVAVEHTLDSLIFGKLSDEMLQKDGVFDPSAEECMYLAAAVRLRCIGLLWGLFPDSERTASANPAMPADYDNSSPTQPNWMLDDGRLDSDALQKLIETFPRRSSQFILRYWHFNCSWTNNQKAILCSILNGYLPTVLEDEIPEKINGIRVRKLAYLLRVGTSCTIGESVCPLEIRLRLKPDSCCDMRKTHLSPVKWIVGTIFDHGRNVVEFRANVPAIERIPDPRDGDHVLPLATIDYAPALDFLGTVVQEVIDTVSGYLEHCPNTCIRSVKVQTHHYTPGAMNPGQSFLPDNWALLLAAAINAAEVAGTTALILRSFCEYGFPEGEVSFVEQVSQVCEASERMHPCNALVQQLIKEVREFRDWKQEPSEQEKKRFHAFLSDYLLERADAGDRVADRAVDQGALKDAEGREVDRVFIYGYSRCVLSTIIKSRFRGEVCLVVASHTNRPWVQKAAERTHETLEQNRIKVRAVSLENVSLENRRSIQRDQSSVFLTGTRCVLQENNGANRILCSPGANAVAAAFTKSTSKTVVLAEKEKILTQSDQVIEVEQQMNRLIEEEDNAAQMQVDILQLPPESVTLISA